jgi:hypothetical protein
MKSNVIDSISQYLNTPPNIELIFNKLREKGLYIENQVIINDL